MRHSCKKVTNLRSAFRKGHKKVLKSQVSGAGAEEAFAPRLWYYNQLLFLCDQDAPHSSTSSMQEEEETTAIAAQHNNSMTAGIMEMICTHLNYTLS
jgi:DNA polymerase IIIc chi subunit